MVAKTTEVVNIVNAMETFLQEKAANVIFRQFETDAGRIVFDCVKAERSDSVLEQLSEEGYTDGPQKSDTIYLREGQIAHVDFRGNIKLDNKEPIQFCFHSNLPSAKRLGFIAEVNKFDQYSLEYFRGHVQLLVEAEQEAEVKQEPEGDVDTTEEEKYPQLELLCEMAITLPKVSTSSLLKIVEG